MLNIIRKNVERQIKTEQNFKKNFFNHGNLPKILTKWLKSLKGQKNVEIHVKIDLKCKKIEKNAKNLKSIKSRKNVVDEESIEPKHENTLEITENRLKN